MNNRKYSPMTIEKMKRQEIIYNMIATSRLLDWINISLYQRDERNVIYDYKQMQEKRVNFQRQGILCAFCMSGLIVCVDFLAIFLELKYNSFGNLNLFGPPVCGALVIVAGIAGMVTVNFWKQWNEFIGVWLDTNWQNKNFADDIVLIVNACIQNSTKLNERDFLEKGLHWLESTELKTGSTEVPLHVIHACDAYVANQAFTIRKYEIYPEGSHIQKDNARLIAFGYREQLKHSFEVFQLFGIISKEVSLRHYYAQAETSLAENELGKNLSEK